MPLDRRATLRSTYQGGEPDADVAAELESVARQTVDIRVVSQVNISTERDIPREQDIGASTNEQSPAAILKSMLNQRSVNARTSAPFPQIVKQLANAYLKVANLTVSRERQAVDSCF